MSITWRRKHRQWHWVCELRPLKNKSFNNSFPTIASQPIYPKIPTRLLCSRITFDWSMSRSDSGLIVAVFRGWRSFWTALNTQNDSINKKFKHCTANCRKSCGCSHHYARKCETLRGWPMVSWESSTSFKILIRTSQGGSENSIYNTIPITQLCSEGVMRLHRKNIAFLFYETHKTRL